jgi:hypothetical protein
LESGNLLLLFQLGNQTTAAVDGQVISVNWTPLSLRRARMAHGGLVLSQQVAMVDQIFGTKFQGQFVSIPQCCPQHGGVGEPKTSLGHVVMVTGRSCLPWTSGYTPWRRHNSRIIFTL